jgi:hypothetical protein
LELTITSSSFVPSLRSKTFHETRGSPFTFVGCCFSFSKATLVGTIDKNVENNTMFPPWTLYFLAGIFHTQKEPK